MKVFMDLDGTCFYYHFARPHLKDSIEAIRAMGCEVVFWTSGTPSFYTDILKVFFAEVAVLDKNKALLPAEPHIVIDDAPWSAPQNVFSKLVEVTSYVHGQPDYELPIMARVVQMMVEGKI